MYKAAVLGRSKIIRSIARLKPASWELLSLCPDAERASWKGSGTSGCACRPSGRWRQRSRVWPKGAGPLSQCWVDVSQCSALLLAGRLVTGQHRDPLPWGFIYGPGAVCPNRRHVFGKGAWCRSPQDCWGGEIQGSCSWLRS